MLPRERSLLQLVARLRLVPLALVHETLFAGRSRGLAGRTVGRMVVRGLLHRWSEPRADGGSPTWTYATTAGRRLGLELLCAAASGTAAEPVVSTMLPSERTRPLALTPRLAPPFLGHQRELATLLVRLARALGASWFSAWERPFPRGAGPVPLPQPDGVLVLPGAVGPEVVLLEHDRGMESPAHFAQTKAERYAELAARPDRCERLLGVPTFRLAVTVEDARFHRTPLERLGRLARLLVEAGVARESLLTLAGWAADAPAGAIWCRAEDPFVPARLRPGDQEPSLRSTLLAPATGTVGSPTTTSAVASRERRPREYGRAPCPTAKEGQPNGWPS